MEITISFAAKNEILVKGDNDGIIKTLSYMLDPAVLHLD